MTTPVNAGLDAEPVVIAVAIPGSVPRESDSPAVPITGAERIESTDQAVRRDARVATPMQARACLGLPQ